MHEHRKHVPQSGHGPSGDSSSSYGLKTRVVIRQRQRGRQSTKYQLLTQAFVIASLQCPSMKSEQVRTASKLLPGQHHVIVVYAHNYCVPFVSKVNKTY
ncbi:hypothetical protein DPMN_081124 [Dreissena polymorpha]|uniref:Uncharacterized protein n=1 Tax=Dreissena polymorpha TaxID=45954 RepID=A0A9D4BG87_DREPO|nr:hypothetical protein DPMN_081124 [Dreissena polymorpha]